MRQIILLALALTVFTNVFSQTDSKPLFSRFYNNQIRAKSDKKELQVFAEINPHFFAYNGYGGGLGVEFSRFQTGFIYLKTELTPTFRDAIFNGASNLTVPLNSASEVFANIYLRKDRKGFYVGALLSNDTYSVIDNITQKKEEFNKQYIATRAGFRWFPFKEYFYIDGSYGVSFNLNEAKTRVLGETTYSTKSVVVLPFIAIGGRISLTKHK